MRFEGEALLDILRRQTEPVLLCDAAGAPFARIKSIGALALELGCSCDILQARIESGVIGVGNRRRVRYLQAVSPTVWGAGWRGGSHTMRPVRARGGRVLGPRKSHLEHVPLPFLRN